MSSGTNGQTKALRIALASAVASKRDLEEDEDEPTYNKDFSFWRLRSWRFVCRHWAAAQGGYSYPDYSRDRDYGRNGDYRNDRTALTMTTGNTAGMTIVISRFNQAT